jgi:hypothetical protein
MTIKQQGGIFGRNPTFNDVTTDGNICAFSANGDFYVRYDGSAATVPTGSIAASTVDLNPGVRDVSTVTTLNIIAPVTTKITLAFYA